MPPYLNKIGLCWKRRKEEGQRTIQWDKQLTGPASEGDALKKFLSFCDSVCYPRHSNDMPFILKSVGLSIGDSFILNFYRLEE